MRVPTPYHLTGLSSNDLHARLSFQLINAARFPNYTIRHDASHPAAKNAGKEASAAKVPRGMFHQGENGM